PIAVSVSFTTAKWRPMQNGSRIVFLLVGDCQNDQLLRLGPGTPSRVTIGRKLVRNDGPIVMDEAQLYHVTFERLGRPVIAQALGRWSWPQNAGAARARLSRQGSG